MQEICPSIFKNNHRISVRDLIVEELASSDFGLRGLLGEDYGVGVFQRKTPEKPLYWFHRGLADYKRNPAEFQLKIQLFSSEDISV